jgi:cellulose synthase/poly-beta-1,6-N-acetylglucosamine synthase-like glycosyltransferase
MLIIGTAAISGAAVPADAPQSVDSAVETETNFASGGLSSRESPSAYASRGERHWLVRVMLWMLYVVIFLVSIYIIRHYIFTINRMFGEQRQPYIDIDTAEWPEVTILIPAHNEEPVIETILDALLDVDYPPGNLMIIPINDRSSDKTGEIVDDFAKRHPDIVKPYHRKEGMPGKAAALNDVTERVQTEVMLVFDADYIPGRGLIKQLVAPFFDPEVGAVMGRVVPHNVESNLLARLLDLERSGGYQVDQQARMNMRLVPQYGGTVGGVRRSAILEVGGWREESLAEDTDATYRLLIGGWKTIYQNRSECYEEVPASWPSRRRQIKRWAQGHNQATARFSGRLLLNLRTRFIEKVDGLLLLGIYLMSPVLLLGWTLGMILWYLGEPTSSLIIILAVTSYSALGNFAIFFEVTAAARLDGSRKRIRLLPFVFLGFLVSLITISRATLSQLVPRRRGKTILWHKTERERQQKSRRDK